MTTSADRIQQLLAQVRQLQKRLREHHKVANSTQDRCDICLDADESGDE